MEHERRERPCNRERCLQLLALNFMLLFMLHLKQSVPKQLRQEQGLILSFQQSSGQEAFSRGPKSSQNFLPACLLVGRACCACRQRGVPVSGPGHCAAIPGGPSAGDGDGTAGGWLGLRSQGLFGKVGFWDGWVQVRLDFRKKKKTTALQPIVFDR